VGERRRGGASVTERAREGGHDARHAGPSSTKREVNSARGSFGNSPPPRALTTFDTVLWASLVSTSPFVAPLVLGSFCMVLV
jgi:hypothetical protein